MHFEDLRLDEPLLRAVRSAGYETPTPIQAQAIPHILAGKDVLGCAQTGTGKTAAFALPILHRLSQRSAEATGKRRGVRTLVLSPTRELAQQIHDSFRTYGRFTKLRQTAIFGGVNQNPQVRAVRNGAEILIATPGRLLDLMNQRLVNITGTEILVLDEADRMLDMGFLPDLRRIFAQVPNKRQSLLFSATMPAPIRKLAGDILHNPVSVEVTPVSSATPLVDHWVHHVEKPNKPTLLLSLLEKTQHTRALVFTRTKHGADKVVRNLTRAGVPAAALHGNKSQGARTKALREFRSAQTRVLVATDIAARGLDVDDISHVINYDLTPEPETYVHRIGRTGRAGASGTAVSFCSAEEHDNLRAIERLICKPLQRADGGPANANPPAARRGERSAQAKKPRASALGKSAARAKSKFAAQTDRAGCGESRRPEFGPIRVGVRAIEPNNGPMRCPRLGHACLIGRQPPDDSPSLQRVPMPSG
jgi:ATP-dependent RNA helicase RhlE